jgi:hypothetical protein
MAKKRRAKARRSLRIRTMDLKKLCSIKDERTLKAALKKACASKVAIIVHNAPFKLEAVG